MRNGIILAVALTVLSASGAQAEQWCGYAGHKDAVVECGYMTAADCADAVGKGGMCFVDPDYAENSAHATRITPVRPSSDQAASHHNG